MTILEDFKHLITLKKLSQGLHQNQKFINQGYFLYDGALTNNYNKRKDVIEDYGDKYELIDPSQYVIGIYIHDEEVKK